MTQFRFLSLPEAETVAIASPDGAVLPLYALGGPAGAPGVLVGHANGLAAGSYAPWLRTLARRLRVFAYDARGHGGSLWPEGPLDLVFHVDRFADDLQLVASAVASRLGGAPLCLAGHSLGAAAALRLATRGGALPWSRALLFEPPIFPPPSSPHYAEAAAKQKPLIERSATRRAQFESPEALEKLLSGRGPFARFRPDMLAAHCRATLRPLPEGGCTLACPPQVESACFVNHRDADTWSRLSRIRAPIHLVGGDPSLHERGWVSALIADMAREIPGARLTVIPGADHLMMFEDPEPCRDLVFAEAGTLG